MSGEYGAGRIAKVVGVSILAVLVTLVCIVGIWIAVKTIQRSQARADANNRVRVTAINIRNAGQQVKVQQQLAKVKYAESVGIRNAQDEISKTLTPLYVQHEAIQAQEKMTGSPNHTTIYVPSGDNGVPLIRDTNEDQGASK